jgi:hypothetical protein
MAFFCPQCGRRGSLAISQRIELPPDSRSDEITVQVILCSDCQFSGLAVYEESRRGSFESDSWLHTGYFVAEKDLQTVRLAIQDCPDPDNARCNCSVHRSLGRVDAQGCWLGLEGIEPLKSFALVM